jgi:glycine/D-amino acid oxidase-like deaminating enzyme
VTATIDPPVVNGGVSFWIQDAGGRPEQRRPLPGPIAVDVAVVGAGLTGLWTAYYLKRERPDLDIAVVEREFAGFGASGRNGGWMSAEPAGQFRRYAAAHGEEAARALQQEMFQAVRESAEVARREGFEDATAHTGLIHFATNAAQLARAQAHVRAMREQGWGEDDVQELSAADLAARVQLDHALGGYATQHCVRVHPAKYVFGLANAVERLGVPIYEGTTATAVEPHRVVTDRGVVEARWVVQALEGYTQSLADQRRRLLPMNSSMVITEPLSDAHLESIGWRGSELLGDVAHSFTYMQRTADSRIAIGGRGVPYDFASSFDRNGRTADFAIDSLRARLGELFPALRNVRLEHAWSGVLGVPRDWCAAVTVDRAAGVLRVGGYTGHGLSGTNLAARTARDLVLGRDSALTRLPWVGRTARNWEPEPLRWIGATALYAAYRYADRRETATGAPRTHLTARVADRISGR